MTWKNKKSETQFEASQEEKYHYPANTIGRDDGQDRMGH